VLLATDLSARCDRASDRAAILAREWGASLVAVHALEQSADVLATSLGRRLPSWYRQSDPVRIATDQLRHDLSGMAPAITAIVEQADPTDLVLRVAAERDCGLIVTGIARDETLGRFGLGTTVDRLLPRSAVPLLIVRERARSGYRHLVVATDFSQESALALDTAVAFFPDARITVLHTYDTPLARVSDDRDALDAQYRRMAEEQLRHFLEAGGHGRSSNRAIELVAERGPLTWILGAYVRDHGADLVVVGTEGRGALGRLVFGSDARDVVASAHSDVMVVRTPTAA
jgi:nucleotide-binding universal stress UspA family protein